MKRNEKIIIGIIIAIVVLTQIWWFGFRKRTKDLSDVPRSEVKCETEPVTLKMTDSDMVPVFKEGEELKVIPGYYLCNKVKPFDIVVHRASEAATPIVRVVRGKEGDVYELQKDAKGRGWNIILNGDVMKDVGDSPFFFGPKKSAATLSLYINVKKKEKSHTLKAREFLVFAVKPPGHLDSGHLGLFGYEGLRGKVILNPEQEARYKKWLDEIDANVD